MPRRTFLIAGTSLLVLLLAAGVHPASARGRMSAVAVFPVDNLTGIAIPAEPIRQAFMDRLTAEGVRVLDDAALEAFMARHRVRYAAGIDAATGEALRTEAAVDGVLLVSVDLSSDATPPKVGLTARLLSLEDTPVVAWADDVGMAGDDAPGLLELGIVSDYGTLLARALDRLTASLGAHMQTGARPGAAKRASKFRPRIVYDAVHLDTARTYSIAVLPFHNISTSRRAGDIVGLLFVRHMSQLPQLRVLDVGVVRRELLSARIIMDGGPSISDADTVAALVEADYVLGGRVLTYLDREGPDARPRVEFSTVLIERTSRKVVWSSDSYNDGGDGVRWFGRGQTRTAHGMATQMVALAVDMIANGRR